jgi:S1-C subfamily serine protease
MSLRAFLPVVALFVAAGLIAPGAFAQDKQPEKLDGAGVYKKAIHSVVWVHSKRTNGLATGSGSLVDKEKRLVLTNYHVVQDTAAATVFFPAFRDGVPVAEKAYYKDRASRLGVGGRVIALDKKADLALIRLDAVPKDTDALPLAPASPSPGDTVHSIGSPGKTDSLFGYVKGSVRQVYNDKWRAELEPRKIATFEAKVISTDSPTNPGDSGGPLLNDKGELVGVTQGGAINAQSISTFIDVSEVKQLLNHRAVRDLKADKADEPAKPRTPPTVSDGAKLFSDDAVKAANDALAELAKAKLFVVVETHKTATADEKKLDELRKAKPADRTAFLRDFTRERMKKAGGADVGIVVCNDPRSLYVELTDDMRKQFPDDIAKRVVDALTAGLRAGKPDDALKGALQLIKDSRKGAK